MLDLSKVYTSNFNGDFRIIKYNNHVNVEVEFIATGYKTTTRTSHILSGKIKDKLHPSVFGVGFNGVGKYKPSTNNKTTKSYDTWRSMMSRCYSKNYQHEKPTYAGCTVCKEWHNFQNFAKWFESYYIEGFELDKDIIFKGNKWYSPITCMFVSQNDNAIKAHAKSYKMINPKGETVEIYNMREFCRENKLSAGSMNAVYLGKNKTHRGWKPICPS